MLLQADPTVQYAIGHHVSRVDYKDLEIDSRYNTYKYAGLPPTPINSPSKDTLRAALNPAPGSWLYFTLVNLDTGETAFASSPDEHMKNVQKLQAWCQAHTGRC
jgi:UPF0755 protein